MIGIQPPGLRLTLTTAVPETVTDVTGATTLYYTPDTSGVIWLYVSGRWRMFKTAEISLAVGTLASVKPHDVFAFATGGTVTLEFLIWTSASARATPIVRQDGFKVKSGDATRLLVGTIYPSDTTHLADSLAFRGVSNVYNTRTRVLRSPSDTTDTWAGAHGGLGVFRQARATATNKFELVQCEPRMVFAQAVSYGKTATPVQALSPGIGIDSTTVNSCVHQEVFNVFSTNTANGGYCFYQGFPNSAGGYNAFNWLESDTVDVVFFGDGGVTYLQTGMFGTVQG